MLRNVSIGSVFLLAFLPLAASAQTVDQQTQIQGLLQQVAQLQQILANLQATRGSTGTAASCPNPPLSRALSYGSTGADVTALQVFLIAQGDLAPGNNTGYFGSLTQAAVQKFQRDHGVVSSGSPESTGYGVVGPKTRTTIAQVCSSGVSGVNTVTGYVNGFAPPNFNSTTGVSSGAPGVITPAYISLFYASPNVVNFGQSVTFSWNVQNTGGCVLLQQLPNQPATTINPALPASGSLVTTPINTAVYTLLCTSLGLNGAGASQSVNVTVNGAPNQSQSSTSFWASPTMGKPPLTVAFNIPVNSSGSCAGGSQFLDFGDGNNTTASFAANACNPTAYSIQHTYSATSTYTATLYTGSTNSTSVFGSVAITVGATSTVATSTSSTASSTVLVLKANPQNVNPGDIATLSWSAINVTSCSLTASPAGFSSQAIAGQQALQFVTPGTTTFTFACTGLNGQTYATSTSVVAGQGNGATSTAATSSAPTITISTPTTGTTVSVGQQLGIQWASANVPQNLSDQPAVLLNLVHSADPANITTPIDYLYVTNNTSGTYAWTIPSSSNTSCGPIPNGMCGKNIPPGQYKIQGLLLTSKNHGNVLASTTSAVFTVGTSQASTTNQQQSQISLTATPQSGAVPLLVNFTGSAPGNGYQLDFGDGSPIVGAGVSCGSSSVTCTSSGSVSNNVTSFNTTHIYTQNGSFTAKLSSVGCAVSAAGPCLSTSTVIMVGGSSTASSTLIATPKSGASPLQVTFTGVAQSGSFSLDYGDGSQVLIGGSGTAPSQVNTTHMYQTDGTYKAILSIGGTAVASTTIQVGAGSTPVCNGTSVNALDVRGKIITELAAGLYRKMYNAWPSAAEFTNLITNFLPAHYDYQLKTNPTAVTMMTGQDLGAGLANGGENGATTFRSTYGSSTIPTSSAFNSRAWNDIYGSSAGTAIPDYTSELATLQNLYAANASSFPANTDFNLIARGAIFGEIYGLAIAQNIDHLAADADGYVAQLCQNGFTASVPAKKSTTNSSSSGSQGSSISSLIGGL